MHINGKSKESEKIWSSHVVQILEKTYPTDGTTNQKTLFLIKALIELQEKRSPEQYDYYFGNPEKIEEERNEKELLEFSIKKFTELKESLDKKVNPTSNKLIWKGTPGQFAFILNILQDKGYISGLTQSGEKNAEISLNIFEFEEHNPTKASLGKLFQMIKKDELTINPEDASKFQKIPNRKDLKR